MPEILRNLTLPLLALLASLCLPGSALAKTVIGVIMPSGTPNSSELQRVFRDTLKEEAPAASTEIITQHPYPDAIAMGNATRKLVAAGADLIVTYGTSATIAALNEKTKLPLIYSGVYDPDNAPFTGLDLTGCGYKVPLTSLLRHLREFKTINTLSAIYCSLENDSVRQLNELAELSKAQQITLLPINLKDNEELDKFQLGKGDAIFITGGNIVNLRLNEIIAIAQANQQPTAGLLPDFNEELVTISLYCSPQAQSRKTAQIALQIMEGHQPRDIKPETLRNTELVFNLRGAKSIGVKIPFQMVAEASRVIK